MYLLQNYILDIIIQLLLVEYYSLKGIYYNNYFIYIYIYFKQKFKINYFKQKKYFYREHFIQVNGMSNKYWGWGLEDDEFYVRLKEAGLTVIRPQNISTGTHNTFK